MAAMLEIGDLAPWFVGATPTAPAFNFSTVGGRYVLLGFLSGDPQVLGHASTAMLRIRRKCDGQHLAAFIVLGDQASIERARDQAGLRWFLDPDHAIARQYGAYDDDQGERPHWLLLDPSMRVMERAPMDDSGPLFEKIDALPAVEDYAGVPLHAPVLIVPRILEPGLCRRLVDYYEADGGAPSGVMRNVDGRTVGVLDDFKRRRDAFITDQGLQEALRLRLARRLAPEIEKAFQFHATRLERYIVACYDAVDGGYFRAHRDNQTFATAHRRFAVSINLNAEEFEGGDLRFPEFGARTYRPPTGGAVVFACGLQHEATPVTRGRRYAFLPFLYGDVGEAIRAEGQRRMGSTQG